VDLRPVAVLPPAQRIEGVLVVIPEELIANKLLAFHHRRGTPKSGTDWRDLAMLLLAFPHFKTSQGPVRDRLAAAGADDQVLATWDDLVAQEIHQEEDEEGPF
jgi:hypothetical protein